MDLPEFPIDNARAVDCPSKVFHASHTCQFHRIHEQNPSEATCALPTSWFKFVTTNIYVVNTPLISGDARVKFLQYKKCRTTGQEGSKYGTFPHGYGWRQGEPDVCYQVENTHCGFSVQPRLWLSTDNSDCHVIELNHTYRCVCFQYRKSYIWSK